MKKIQLKIKYFLERLSSRPQIGGLQITDSSLQYVHISGEPKSFALRLPPGVLKDGRIQDQAQFASLLLEFHKTIEPLKDKLKLPVVISLPAVLAYTQSFNVPNIGEEKLNESAELNLQMLSPMAKDSAYMSWQKLSESPDHFELFGAFVEKSVVDQFWNFFEAANFSPVAFEFPSLALARLVNQTVNATNLFVLLFQISSDGLDLSIFRNGFVYFNYFRSWRSIQGEQKEILRDNFYAVVTEEIQKVINFGQNRFKENLNNVFLVAPGFELEMQQFLEKQFNLQVTPIRLRAWNLAPNWYVSLGSALRGMMDRGKDAAISLAPVSSIKVFYEEQAFSFVQLWRNAISSVLVLFLIFYAGSAYFLRRESQRLETQLSAFKNSGGDNNLAQLETKVSEFNRLVVTIKSSRETYDFWHSFLNQLKSITAEENIVVNNINLSSLNDPISLTAKAANYDKATKFKDRLVSEPIFSEVNLPVPEIKVLEDNSVIFTITFKVKHP